MAKLCAAALHSFSDTPQFQIADGRSIVDGRRYHVATLRPLAARASAMREREPVGMKSPTAVCPAQSTKQGGLTRLIRIQLAKFDKWCLSREHGAVCSQKPCITRFVRVETVRMLNRCRRLRRRESEGTERYSRNNCKETHVEPDVEMGASLPANWSFWPSTFVRCSIERPAPRLRTWSSPRTSSSRATTSAISCRNFT